MKVRAVIGAATLVACGAPLAAQGPARAGRPGMRANLPGYLADHPQTLNLSDAQAARLRTIAQWLDQSDSSLRSQLRAALGGRSRRGMTAEQRYQLSLQMRPLTAQLRANRLAMVDSVHAVLSTDQWQRLDERRMSAWDWGRGFRRGFARGRFGYRRGPGWGPPWWRRPA
jgi:hypothetical protein